MLSLYLSARQRQIFKSPQSLRNSVYYWTLWDLSTTLHSHRRLNLVDGTSFDVAPFFQSYMSVHHANSCLRSNSEGLITFRHSFFQFWITSTLPLFPLLRSTDESQQTFQPVTSCTSATLNYLSLADRTCNKYMKMSRRSRAGAAGVRQEIITFGILPPYIVSIFRTLSCVSEPLSSIIKLML